LKYRKGFKYQLAEAMELQTCFTPKIDLISDFVILRTTGELDLLKGFAWDGPSGPVLDRGENMIASAGHDALYRLMRKWLLPHTEWKKADQCYGGWLKDGGAWPITIKINMMGLAIAKGAAASPANQAKIYEVYNEATSN